MKKLVNKEIEVAGEKLTYAQLIINMLPSIPDGGLTYDEIKKRSRLENVLEKCVDLSEIVLEDADATYLEEFVTKLRYAVYDRKINLFIEDVKNMNK